MCHRCRYVSLVMIIIVLIGVMIMSDWVLGLAAKIIWVWSSNVRVVVPAAFLKTTSVSKVSILINPC